MPPQNLGARGVPQGCILGPVLFNFAMTQIARQLETDTTSRFAIYADDLTVWTEAADYSDVESTVTELQAAAASLAQSFPSLG